MRRVVAAIKPFSLLTFCAAFGLLAVAIRQYTRSALATLLVLLQLFLFAFSRADLLWELACSGNSAMESRFNGAAADQPRR